MGSEQNDRNGLKRAGDGAQGYPEQFIIVDLDIGADVLKSQYAGTKRHAYACGVIDGAVQRQRTKRPPSDAFVRGLRRAKAIPSIDVCDIGRDKDGVNHVIVIDGRQRNMATRANNAASTEPPRMLTCVYQTFGAKDTQGEVVMFKVGANVRELRTASSRAEDAADMMRRGISMDDIAPYVEAKDTDEVALLVLLDGCDDAVKDAVDAGAFPLLGVKAISAFAPEEQARRVVRKVAPNRKAADAAAPPRPKGPNRAKVAVTLTEVKRIAKSGGSPAKMDVEEARAEVTALRALLLGFGAYVIDGTVVDGFGDIIESAANAERGKATTREEAQAAE